MWLVSRPPAFVTLTVVWALHWRYILKQMKARREMLERQQKGLTLVRESGQELQRQSTHLLAEVAESVAHSDVRRARNCGAFTPRLFRRQKFVPASLVRLVVRRQRSAR